MENPSKLDAVLGDDKQGIKQIVNAQDSLNQNGVGELQKKQSQDLIQRQEHKLKKIEDKSEAVAGLQDRINKMLKLRKAYDRGVIQKQRDLYFQVA